MEESASEIIIIKKKVGHGGGHHGGAWKVAYADFVTAMMALFIVLWLMNASKQVQDAVGGYFEDPARYRKSCRNQPQWRRLCRPQKRRHVQAQGTASSVDSPSRPAIS